MSGQEAGRGVELIYEDSRVVLSKRPNSCEELLSVVLKMVPEAGKPSDVVLEYCSSAGVKTILSDLSLHEAYASAAGPLVIIGIRLAKSYVPFEMRQRGHSQHSRDGGTPEGRREGLRSFV